MDLAELITALKDPLNVVAGAFATLLGTLIQNRLSSTQAKTKLRLEKLERAYSLCQQVYDGHLRELKNLNSLWKTQPTEFLKNRKHPGPEMSELKMVIRCYAPELEADLQLLDNGHGPLKRMFERLESGARIPGKISSAEFDTDSKKADQYLEALGNAANSLKLKLASGARLHTK